MNWQKLHVLFKLQSRISIGLLVGILLTMTTCGRTTKTTHILFIGNSYTYRNSMPHLFKRIAESRGEQVQVKHVTRGKYTFYLQAKRELIAKALKYQRWDYIILQGSSRDLLKDSVRMHQKTYPAIEKLLSSFKSKQPRAKVYFYMTWPYKEGYKPDERFATDSLMLEGIEMGYRNLKAKYGIPVIPVGRIWYNFKKTYPAINLYVKDRSHPSFEGSYLVACVMYEALFNKSSIGAEKHRLHQKELSEITQRFVTKQFYQSAIQAWLKP